MKKLITSSIIAISLASTLCAKDTYYASVNGDKITKDTVSMALQNNRVDFEKLPKDTQAKILNEIIDRKLIVKKAVKDGVEKDEKYKKLLNQVKESIVFQVWKEKEFDSIKVNEKEEKKFYDENKDKFKKPANLNARHILVKTEKEAQELIKELDKAKKKEDTFIKLAKSKSVGPSGKNGGDLGEFPEDRMVPEFSKAAKALDKGTYSKKPVKTQFGYHIIFLKDKTASSILKFDEVKDKIKRVLIGKKYNEKVKELVKDLRKKAKIVIK
ncbi:MAG: peptidyl-prolyl cis-trans isomerase [Arcobacter sp.]|nr:peptidyl-prolyl cis-trans isomerase [Arcobacter sp.]